MSRVMMEVGKSPSMVIAANPALLMGLINICRRKNMRIPDDVIVAGAVEENSGNYLDAPFIALVKPTTEMGGQAAQMVLDILSGVKEAKSCRLKLTTRIPEEVRKFWK